MGKFIINFTPNGIYPTKKMSPYVPVGVKEIIKEVLDARKFGVSIVHLQARDKNGTPTWEKEIYEEIINGIRAVDGYTNDSLVICVSSDGCNRSELKSWSKCFELKDNCKPDMGSLNLSSLGFSDSNNIGSMEMIQKLATKMKSNGIKVGLDITSNESVSLVQNLHKKEIIEPPFYFNVIPERNSNKKLDMFAAGNLISQLPKNSYWTFGGTGTSQLKMNTMAIINGGGIRVGIGDNIYFDEEQQHLASNEDLLDRINEIAVLLDSAPYTPSEVREMLKLEIE